MAAGKNVNENKLDNGILSKNNARDQFPGASNFGSDVVGAGYDAQFGWMVHAMRNLLDDCCGLAAASLIQSIC